MTPHPLADRIAQLERQILKGEQALCGEIDAIKRRHREQQAGSPRSHELEDARRELRKIAREIREAALAQGVPPSPDPSADDSRLWRIRRLLWSKFTEIGGGKCYIESNLDDLAVEIHSLLKIESSGVLPASVSDPPALPDHDAECERELTSHGYTPCRCARRAGICYCRKQPCECI